MKIVDFSFETSFLNARFSLLHDRQLSIEMALGSGRMQHSSSKLISYRLPDIELEASEMISVNVNVTIYDFSLKETIQDCLGLLYRGSRYKKPPLRSSKVHRAVVPL